MECRSCKDYRHVNIIINKTNSNKHKQENNSGVITIFTTCQG